MKEDIVTLMKSLFIPWEPGCLEVSRWFQNLAIFDDKVGCCEEHGSIGRRRIT